MFVKAEKNIKRLIKLKCYRYFNSYITNVTKKLASEKARRYVSDH